MTEDCLISNGPARAGQRPSRPWRPWLWGASASLRNGGMAAILYLALRTGHGGAFAVAAFISGYLLEELMKATSQGD